MKITQNHAYATSTNTTDVEYYATIADNQVLVSPSKREVTTHLPAAALDEEIATVTNECYSTSRLPSPTRPRVHQQQDIQYTQNLTTDAIPTVTNECYSTSRLPSPTHPRVHQQQDMQLTQNQVSVTSASVSMKTNESFGTTTPSMDSDHLYATVDTSQQPKEEEYDYVIPYDL